MHRSTPHPHQPQSSFKPATKAEEKDSIENMEGWELAGKTTGGGSGAYCERRKRQTETGTKYAYFKKDDIDKAITEVFIGRFMRRLNQRLLDATGRGSIESTADVDLVVRTLTPEEKERRLELGDFIPDLTGNDIRVRSRQIRGENYRPLYQEIHQRDGKAVPTKRPKQAGTDDEIQRLLYRELVDAPDKVENADRLLVLSDIVDNPDAHIENMGVVNQGEKRVATLIDFGGSAGLRLRSLGLQIRTFDGRLHHNDIVRYVPGLGPTNHSREYPREVRFGKNAAEDYEAFSKINEEHLIEDINYASRDFTKYLGPDPLKEFCKLLGVSTHDLKGANAEKVMDTFRRFFLKQIQNRQKHARDEVVPQIKHSLCFQSITPGSPRDGFKLTNEKYNLMDLIREHHIYFRERTHPSMGSQFKFLGRDQDNYQQVLSAQTRAVMKHVSSLSASASIIADEKIQLKEDDQILNAKAQIGQDLAKYRDEYSRLPENTKRWEKRNYARHLAIHKVLLLNGNLDSLRRFSITIKKVTEDLKELKKIAQGEKGFYYLERIFNNSGKYKNWQAGFTGNGNILKTLRSILKIGTELIPKFVADVSWLGFAETKSLLIPNIRSVGGFFKYLLFRLPLGILTAVPCGLTYVASRAVYLVGKRITSPVTSMKDAYQWGREKTGSKWGGRILAGFSGLISCAGYAATALFTPIGLGALFAKLGTLVSSVLAWVHAHVVVTTIAGSAVIGAITGANVRVAVKEIEEKIDAVNRECDAAKIATPNVAGGEQKDSPPLASPADEHTLMNNTQLHVKIGSTVPSNEAESTREASAAAALSLSPNPVVVHLDAKPTTSLEDRAADDISEVHPVTVRGSPSSSPG